MRKRLIYKVWVVLDADGTTAYIRREDARAHIRCTNGLLLECPLLGYQQDRLQSIMRNVSK